MTGMRFLFVLAMLGANGAIAAEDQSQSEAPALRQRAEDLARAASQRFTEILDTGKQTEPSSTQADGKGSPTPYARVVDWLARSSKSYDDIVIAELKSKDGWTTLVQRSGADAPAPAASGAAPELRGWSGLVELLRYWLARANSAYRNEIVQPLRVPNGGTAPGPIQRAEQPKQTVAPSGTAPVAASDSEAAKRKQQAEEQIKREAEAADRLRHAQEARRAADEELARLKAQQEKAAAERRAEEEKRLAAAAEEKRKAQAEARARLIAEADERRNAEAAAQAEAKRKAEAEQKRIAAEAEEKRKAAAAEEQRKAEAEKQRLAAAAETKRQAEEADAAERRAVAQAEAEAKRQAEIDAEATRRSEAAAKAKAAARASVAVQPAPPSTAPASSPSAATTPPQSQPEKKAERLDSQRSAAKENSAISLAPTAPERKPQLPQGSAKATPKKREEVIASESAPQPEKSGKQAKRVVSKKHKQAAYAYAKPRYKQHHVYKASHGKRGKAHIRKHRMHGADKVFVVRGCRCVCGSYIQRPRQHHWGRVTHRHRIHYID